MQTILISPYSKTLRTCIPNAKNFPYWKELVSLLVQQGYEVIQVGAIGEEIIPKVSSSVFGASLSQLKELINKAFTWISVDNFFPHLAVLECNKPGIVLWGKSDPKLFGHPSNLNLLKDRKYLRPFQFAWWDDEVFDAKVFVSPEVVVNVLKESFSYDNTK